MTRQVTPHVAFVGLLSLAITGCGLFRPQGREDARVSGPTQSLMLNSPATASERHTALSQQDKYQLQLATARSLERRGQVAAAEQVYRQLTETATDNSAAFHRLAVLHEKQGSFDEARAWFDKALEIAPDDAALRCDAGYSSYLHGRYEEAEEHLRCALAKEPKLGRARNNLALVLARTGREAEALWEFRRGGCSDVESHLNVAFALTLERRWQEAQQHYHAAQAADPTSDAARQGLENVRHLATKFPETEPEAADISQVVRLPDTENEMRQPLTGLANRSDVRPFY
jgi:tetratricopeptide (TPR) repeat protein